MSDVMLHGVLNMPLPDDPAECDFMTWMQFKQRARQASARIEELEAKLAAKEKLMLTLAGHKIDLVSELAGVKGKLAKALELAEEALDFNDDGNDYSGWRSIFWRIKELKGQDDE